MSSLSQIRILNITEDLGVGTDVGISADGYHIIVGEHLATAHSGQSFSHKGSFHVFKATS
jgi:hypothetical protein